MSAIDPVVQDDTSTSLSPSETAIAAGDSVTFIAWVDDDSDPSIFPTGSVDFYDGSTLLDSAVLSAGSASITTTSLLATVSHSITAVYRGNSRFIASTSPAVTLTPASTSGGSGGSGGGSLIATTLTLSPSATTLSSGDSVTLTAVLSTASAGASAPTGTVAIYDGSTLLATQPLVGGTTAVLTVTLSGTASHALTAVYSGDSLYAAVSSSGVIVNSSEPFAVTFLPYMTKSPEFTFDRSIATPTATATIQNVSGDTVRRDSATIFSREELTGALFIFRVWRDDCETALLTVVGNVKDPSITPDGESMTLPLQALTHWSDIQAPRMEIGVGCDLTFASPACGSTSTTQCNNDYGSCSSRERFPGVVLEWAGAAVDDSQTVQPEPLRLFNNKRA